MIFLLAACLPSLGEGGGLFSDPLSVDAVTTVPEGDASGETWQGQYQTEIYTTSCEGSCGPVQDGLFTVSFCDVGDRDTEYLQVEQTNGLLQVEVNDPISYYQGGVDDDASMVMGGYATEYGGSVELTALIEGHFGEDALIAEASARMWGTVELDDQTVDIDCEGTYTLEGSWISELATR